MDSSSFDLVAASLRADAVDIRSFVETLAVKLAESFPGHVEIERRRRLRGVGPVRRIVVSLGDDRYALDHDAGSTTCSRSAMVRGIALRSEQVELDAWIDQLARSLVLQAEASEQSRNALARLLV